MNVAGPADDEPSGARRGPSFETETLLPPRRADVPKYLVTHQYQLVLYREHNDQDIIWSFSVQVGGIMAFLSIAELLPLSIEHAGRKAAAASLFVGMACMSLLLFVADNYLGHGEEGHGHGHGHGHSH